MQERPVSEVNDGVESVLVGVGDRRVKISASATTNIIRGNALILVRLLNLGITFLHGDLGTCPPDMVNLLKEDTELFVINAG